MLAQERLKHEHEPPRSPYFNTCVLALSSLRRAYEGGSREVTTIRRMHLMGGIILFLPERPLSRKEGVVSI
jgi:hypothetical protein